MRPSGLWSLQTRQWTAEQLLSQVLGTRLVEGELFGDVVDLSVETRAADGEIIREERTIGSHWRVGLVDNDECWLGEGGLTLFVPVEMEVRIGAGGPVDFAIAARATADRYGDEFVAGRTLIYLLPSEDIPDVDSDDWVAQVKMNDAPRGEGTADQEMILSRVLPDGSGEPVLTASWEIDEVRD